METTFRRPWTESWRVCSLQRAMVRWQGPRQQDRCAWSTAAFLGTCLPNSPRHEGEGRVNHPGLQRQGSALRPKSSPVMTPCVPSGRQRGQWPAGCLIRPKTQTAAHVERKGWNQFDNGKKWHLIFKVAALERLLVWRVTRTGYLKQCVHLPAWVEIRELYDRISQHLSTGLTSGPIVSL
jgi:hypothetical protein